MSKKKAKKQKSNKPVENPEKVKASKSYGKAHNRAKNYMEDPDELAVLVEKARKKAKEGKGPLDEVWDRLNACFRLLKAYASGEYREVPWKSLIMLVTAVTYFVMPIDLVPDFIVGLGLTDDIALLGWTLKSCSTDLDGFVAWEAEHS